MSDVFDEDLARELGLDPEELETPAPKPAKKPIVSPKSQNSQQAVVPPAVPAAPTVAKTAPGVKPPASPTARTTVAPKQAETSEEEFSEHAVSLSHEIPVQLAAVLAKKSVSLKEILELKAGEILEFKKLPQEPLDLVANGKLVAKAELVLIDGKVGARILKLIK